MGTGNHHPSDADIAKCLVFEREGDTLVARIIAERFADREAEAVKGAVCDRLRSCSYRVIVDLTPVAYVASTGLGVLVSLRELAIKHGGGLAVFGAHPDMAELFRLTHLDHALNLRETRAEAASVVGGA